jgi:hypothetical protein
MDKDLLSQLENSLSHKIVHKNLSKHAIDEICLIRLDQVYSLSELLRSINWLLLIKVLYFVLTKWLYVLLLLPDLFQTRISSY